MTTVIEISGNLTGSSDRKAEIMSALATDQSHVIVDLQNVSRLSSWGEGRVMSLASGVVFRGGRLAVVRNKDKWARYEGLRLELEALEGAAMFDDLDAARSFVEADPP